MRRLRDVHSKGQVDQPTLANWKRSLVAADGTRLGRVCSPKPCDLEIITHYDFAIDGLPGDLKTGVLVETTCALVFGFYTENNA